MNVSSWHSTMTALAGALERRHPKERKLLADIACKPSHPCPLPCSKRDGFGRRCGRRHEPPREGWECKDMATIHPCLACELVALYPLAASSIDPGDGLRSPSTEGGSRSIGTHSAPTEMTAINHVDREATTLRQVASLLADAEEALRLALSTVEDA